MTLLLALAILTQDVNSKIDEFAKTIPGDGLAARVRETLLSPAGKPAIKEQIGALTGEARANAAKTAVPDYFKEHFDDEGRLREGSKAHAEELLRELATFESDRKEMRALVDAIADKIPDEPAYNAQVKKILKDENGQLILYATQLRVLAGRDEARIERIIKPLMDLIFEADADGRLVVREAMKEKIEQSLEERYGDKVDRVEKLAKSLAALAEKIKDDGGLNSRLRKAFASSVTAAAILEMKEDVDGVDDAFVERDGKLVIGDEHVETAEKILAKAEEQIRTAGLVRGPMLRYVARIKDDEGLTGRLRKLLSYEWVWTRLDLKLPAGASTSFKEAFDAWFRTVFEEKDGGWTVKEAHADKIEDGLKKFRREAQNIKRGADVIARDAKRVAEGEPVRVFYGCLYGQARTAEIIKAKVEGFSMTDAQGLDLWIAKHFDNGAIRSSSEAAMEALIRKADEIKKQLEKDDIGK